MKHLAQAKRHVAEGEQRIARQKALIAKLPADGDDTALANAFLQALIASLAVMRQQLQH
jgi:hypothetical protein